MPSFEKKWLWAICYHPMILLIDEDRGEPKILERIPPWGAEALDGYWPRLERSIAFAERDDSFKFSLDISGCELERLAEERQDLIDRLKKLIASKKVEVVGGDYSQPHFQTFLSASALQQFRLGLETFEKNFGVKPDMFAHQEPEIFEQLPQILRAFGYRYACVTMFPWWTIALDDKGPIIHSHFGMVKTSEPDSIAFWRGVDGSEIPIYLRSELMLSPDAIVTASRFYPIWKHLPKALISKLVRSVQARFFITDLPFEPHKGLWSSPRMICEFPDLTEPQRGRIESMKKKGRLVTISEGMEEILQRWPPRAKVRFGTGFGYAEGTWAEELIRECWRAENRLAAAQSWCSLAKTISDFDYDNSQFDDLWKKVLKAQHHDVHWMEPVDLKHKALSWLQGAIEGANELEQRAISSLSKKIEKSDWSATGLRVAGRDLHKLLWPQSTSVESSTPPSIVTLENSNGEKIRGQIKSGIGKNLAELIFYSEHGLGVEFLKVLDTQRAEAKSASRGQKFSGKDWDCELDERGWLRALAIDNYKCAPLARLSAWNKRAGWLEEKAVSALSCEEGDVCAAAKVKIDFGGIPVTRELIAYRDVPLVILRILFEFNGDEIGVFWEDETKLCLVVEFGGVENIWHAIPFGAVSMPAGYGFFSAGWTALESQKSNVGLALLTRGNPRQFYRDGKLFCVLAWGGTRFSLRMPATWDRIDRFDHRLYGKHLLEFALIPYAGDWKSAKIPICSQKFLNPARVDLCGLTDKMDSRRFLESDARTPLFIGLEQNAESNLFVMGHECIGESANLSDVYTDSLRIEKLTDLNDQEINFIKPFGIFRASLVSNK